MKTSNKQTKIILTTKVGRSYLKPAMHNAQVLSNIEGQNVVWQSYFKCRHKARRSAIYHARRLAARIHVHRIEDLPYE